MQLLRPPKKNDRIKNIPGWGLGDSGGEETLINHNKITRKSNKEKWQNITFLKFSPFLTKKKDGKSHMG